MRILFLSFYYQPDLSAGSFRAHAIAETMAGAMPDGTEIDVITTQPNRYQSYVQSASAFETRGPINIHRFTLPSHSSGMLDQSKAYATYARQTLKLVRGRSYDLVVATSGRLLTASLASWIARRRSIPLYLDIRDIFVETICDILPRSRTWAIRPVFSLLERWTIQQAQTVNLVSPGFSQYFKGKYPRNHFTFLTNGIDELFSSTGTRFIPVKI